MTNDEITQIARDVLSDWGEVTHPPRLIRNRENAVFEATFSDGAHAALRLHRTGYQTSAAIQAELLWTEKLSAGGFPCPTPIRTKNGGLIAEGDHPTASLVSWVDGDPIGEMGKAFDGNVRNHCILYHQLGALLADFHNATDHLDLTGLDRPSWGIQALVGPTPHWDKFWQNPALTPTESDILYQAGQLACAVLLDLKDADFGLIHADVLQENVLNGITGLTLIDFDDSGWGFRGYDLGTALIQHAELDYLPQLQNALVEGYQTKRPTRADLIDMFTMLRGLASCGWIISRAAATDPRQQFYADRALRLAVAWLKNRK